LEGRTIRADELAASSGGGQDDGVRKQSGDNSSAHGTGKECNSGSNKDKAKKRKQGFKQ
jgi:hypothetical protein